MPSALVGAALRPPGFFRLTLIFGFALLRLQRVFRNFLHPAKHCLFYLMKRLRLWLLLKKEAQAH